jgi:hypothetical protein
MKTLRKRVDDLAVAMQKLVRLKEAVQNDGYCKCVSCGIVKHWKECDGGHYISRNHQSTKVLEENIHPQCKGCNLKSGKGDTLVNIDYRNWMIEFYGEEFVEELEILARKPADHFGPEIEDQIKEVRAKCKELEKLLSC